MDPALWEQISAVEDRHWWFTGRREIITHLVSTLLPDGASILDIGCGTGFMLEALIGRYDAWGLEPDALVRHKSRQAVRGRILPGDTTDHSRLLGRRFDLVLLLDVLEHVEHDVKALRAAAETVAQNGRLLVTVPANPCLWSAHDERNAHYRRYTPDTLAAVLDAAGLVASRLTHFNSRLYPVVRAHRILSARHTDRELQIPPAPINSLLRWIFAGERHRLERGYGSGLSLAAVASVRPAG